MFLEWKPKNFERCFSCRGIFFISQCYNIGMNSYETACKTNKLAEKFDDKLHEIFKMIDNHENENAIDFEIDELENIYKNIEINEGLSGIFKHYARNLTASIRTYKDSDKDVTLSDLDSEDLIYISSMIDKIIEEEKTSK